MSTYPVHVDARLDTSLSRWLWLVKWLLALPHYVVLAFLWVAFVVLSVVALFAILFTGSYPRAIFDFNVGVLRWSWRVAYYAYGALGTDRYPPFTLAEVPGYPAHLVVDYPQHLSRGLALVKWWLLALPHYLVVGIFLGGGLYLASDAPSAGSPWIRGTGLISLLVLVAAVVLLFTGRYPPSLFDLVLGMNRWVLRVAAYAGLMTDHYPPFRLDQGGPDPDAGELVMRSSDPTGGPSSANPPAPRQAPDPSAGHISDSGGSHAGGWTAGRVIAVVVGSVLLLTSVGLAVGGGLLAIVDADMRDRDGFLMGNTQRLTTPAYALSSESMQVQVGVAGELPREVLGLMRIDVTPSGRDVFVGVASTEDADRFLDGVDHTIVRADAVGAAEPRYRRLPGGPPSVLPTESSIWVASSAGPGARSLRWPIEDGEWTVVITNTDGSAGVSGDVSVGATVPAMGWAVGVVLSVAGTGLVGAVVVLILALRRGGST